MNNNGFNASLRVLSLYVIQFSTLNLMCNPFTLTENTHSALRIPFSFWHDVKNKERALPNDLYSFWTRKLKTIKAANNRSNDWVSFVNYSKLKWFCDFVQHIEFHKPPYYIYITNKQFSEIKYKWTWTWSCKHVKFVLLLLLLSVDWFLYQIHIYLNIKLYLPWFISQKYFHYQC